MSGVEGREGRRTHLGQLSVLVHLQHDIAAAEELAIDVDLRYRRPFTVKPELQRTGRLMQSQESTSSPVLLDAIPHFLIRQDVVRIVRLPLDTFRRQDLNRRPTEATLRHIGCSLHEHDEGLCLNGLV